MWAEKRCWRCFRSDMWVFRWPPMRVVSVVDYVTVENILIYSTCVNMRDVFNNTWASLSLPTVTTVNWRMTYVAQYRTWFRKLRAHRRIGTEEDCTPHSKNFISLTIHNYTDIHMNFLFTMTNTVSSHNIDFSSWITLYTDRISAGLLWIRAGTSGTSVFKKVNKHLAFIKRGDFFK